MGKSLSRDLRSRLVSAVAGGMSRRAAAERFGVSAASAVRWLQAVNTAGTVDSMLHRGACGAARWADVRSLPLI